MPVFAVIPTFNRRETLASCLETLSNQSQPVTIIVSDSGSSDGTTEMLAKRFPAVQVCRGSPDLWWTGATNLGLRAALAQAAPGDHILCINDDTLVDHRYIASIMAAARQGGCLVGSVILAAGGDDRILDGGNWISWYTAAFHRHNVGRRLADFPPGHVESVNILPGRGTLIPAAAFRALGLFDEKTLPHYAADYEFAARCARAGYRLLVSYDAVVRSRTDLSGLHRVRHMSLTEWRKLLFNRRSSANVRDRLALAWATRRNPLQAALFFLMSMARTIGHQLHKA